MVALGREREDVVGITAAMLIPVGLKAFADAYPDRIFDVGIAEQHATTMAAGLAFGGMHPVVAVYATFLNRAFDQLLMDCALHGAGVTFVLDRAGITGPDGASHHGMWDMALTAMVPGLHLSAPRTARRSAPPCERRWTSRRPERHPLPQGDGAGAHSRVARLGSVDVLHEPAASADQAGVDLLLVAVGSMAATALTVAEKLEAQGLRARVVDPRWSLPVSPDLVEAARAAAPWRSSRDSLEIGGVGTHVAAALTEAGVDVPCTGTASHRVHPPRLTGAGARADRLTPEAIAASLLLAMDLGTGRGISRGVQTLGARVATWRPSSRVGGSTPWGAVLGGFLYTYADSRLVDLSGSTLLDSVPGALGSVLAQPLFILGAFFVIVVYFAPTGSPGSANASCAKESEMDRHQRC